MQNTFQTALNHFVLRPFLVIGYSETVFNYFRLPERFCTLSFLRIGYLNKLSCDNLFRDCFAFARNDDIGFRQPETFAKPISLYKKCKFYRVGILAHQSPDRAKFYLISISNQCLRHCGGLESPPYKRTLFCFRLSFAKVSA